MTLGYIVTSSRVKDMPSFVKVVKSTDKIEDMSLPILIVGYKEAKAYTPSFNILNKRISETVFWTFKKNERRNDYERDLEAFYQFLLMNYIKDIKYYYINILKLRYGKLRCFLKLLNSSKHKDIYIREDMLYIFIDGYVVGVSLKILRYCGRDVKKIIGKIYKLPNKQIEFHKYDLFDNIIENVISDKRYLGSVLLDLKKVESN